MKNYNLSENKNHKRNSRIKRATNKYMRRKERQIIKNGY